MLGIPFGWSLVGVRYIIRTLNLRAFLTRRIKYSAQILFQMSRVDSLGVCFLERASYTRFKCLKVRPGAWNQASWLRWDVLQLRSRSVNKLTWHTKLLKNKNLPYATSWCCCMHFNLLAHLSCKQTTMKFPFMFNVMKCHWTLHNAMCRNLVKPHLDLAFVSIAYPG